MGHDEFDALQKELAEIQQMFDITIPEVPEGMGIKEALQRFLQARRCIKVGKDGFEGLLKSLDDDIKTFMAKHGITDRFKDPKSGFGMKVAYGQNETIIKKKVIDALTKYEWDPDQIKQFLAEVTQVTPYDYIDMRELSKKDKGEE